MTFSFRRRRLSCFYCGRRSAQEWNGGLQQWKCSNCDAVNYLDKTGQITEPPTSPIPNAQTSIRYARATSPPPPNESTALSIFCAACLKNQHIVKENLAAFLPSEDSPNYDDLLQGYEAYRKELEMRYPQVCASCAPRAREQIRKAQYVARTDHLRRMMDRTRSHGVHERGGILRPATLITIGGIGWWTGAIAQVLYHALEVAKLGLDETSSSWMDEFRTEYMTDLVPLLLLISLLNIWWNPQLRNKHTRSGEQIQGQTEYYFLQTLCLFVRYLVFYNLDFARQSLSQQALRGLHAVMAGYILMTLFISNKILSLDSKATISFNATDEQLLPDVPKTEHTRTTIPLPNVGSRVHQITPGEALPFPIGKLGTPQNVHNYPPTPPPEDAYALEDEGDEMDWTPSSKQGNGLTNGFQPSPRSNLQPVAQSGPSPFHGTLPPVPLSQNHKLRNPTFSTPGNFKRASNMQQESFFPQSRTEIQGASNTNTGYESDTATETTRLDDDDDEGRDRLRRSTRQANQRSGLHGFGQQSNRRTPKKATMELKEPRMWLKEDMDRETGLEGMFESSFGLQDTPKIPPRTVTESSKHKQKSAQYNGSDRIDGSTPADLSDARSDNADATRKRWMLMLLALVPVGAMVLIGFLGAVQSRLVAAWEL